MGAFAINSDTVKQALIRHLSANKLAGIEHGLDCSESVAPEGKERQHVILAAVGEETPAAAAGLKKGDTLIRVAAYTVANRFDVERAFWDVKPGEKVDLKVVRQGKEITVNLMLTSPTVASR